MASEVDRLHKEGKSDTEIIETMKSKRESFLRKKPAKNGGEW
jgi:cytochrome c-type biogenesis protein CcmH/NrfF